MADVTASTEAAISNITMRRIYNYQSTQSLMIKTFPGGTGATGYVKDSLFEDFVVYDTTYNLVSPSTPLTHTIEDSCLRCVPNHRTSTNTGRATRRPTRAPSPSAA